MRYAYAYLTRRWESCHVKNVKTSLQSLSDFVVSEQLENGVVACDNNLLGPDMYGSALGLRQERVSVGPNFQKVAKLLAIKVIEDHSLFALVAVPPLVLHFQI